MVVVRMAVMVASAAEKASAKKVHQASVSIRPHHTTSDANNIRTTTSGHKISRQTDSRSSNS